MRAVKRVSSPLWVTVNNNAAISTDYSLPDGQEFVTLRHFGSATSITLVQIDDSEVVWPNWDPDKDVPAGRYKGIKANSSLNNVRIGLVNG